MMRIKTICCECGEVIHDGPTLNGNVSHGYCKKCVTIIMANIEKGEYDYDHRKSGE
jgi:hypothetical protein